MISYIKPIAAAAVVLMLAGCSSLHVEAASKGNVRSGNTNLIWGTSPISEPYPYVSTGSFSEPKIPHSPDPLVSYRWPNPKATDGLEIYLLKPNSVSSDRPGSFENLRSLTGNNPNVRVNGIGSIILDFGIENAAWLEFDSPDCPGGIEMSISEYNQPAIVNRGPENPVKTLVPVKYGNTYRLELNRKLYEGVRFGWIHVRKFDKPWHITGVRLVCQTKPANYNGSFACSDNMLTRIWYTGAYVVKLNLLKDYFGAILMDRGDRHSWTGDAHPSQAASLVAFGNYDFIRNNIERTSGKDGILSYRLYWILSVLDYYYYTGDATLLEKYIENICGKLDDAYGFYGTNPRLGFYGWDERLGSGFEVNSRHCPEAHNAYKMLSIRTWTAFAKAMQMLGRTDLKDKYNSYAAEKVAELKQNANWYRDFGVHAQSDAVNAGFSSRLEQQNMFDLEFSDRVNRVSFSSFNQYFIIQAMATMNKYDQALEAVRDLWGGQIEYGGTTFFEVFRPCWVNVLGANDPVPNNQCGFTSLAHPWGAGVVKWLSEEVLGIKPVSPGFDKYEIIPHLGRSLTWVKGHVPTRHGDIQMSINIDNGTALMSAPEGTIGRVGIPKMGKSINSIMFNNVLVWDGAFHSANGVVSADEDSDFVYLDGIEPGSHRLSINYSGTTDAYTASPAHYAADFVKQDSVTSGNWGGEYGNDGYVLTRYASENNDVKSLPSYVNSVEYYKHKSIQWTSGTNDARALAPDKNNNYPRKAACVYTSNGNAVDQPLTLNIEVNETHPYQIALYFVDWNNLERSLAVEMFDAKTLKLIAPVQVIQDYDNGRYLVFNYDKSVKFRIQQIRGANAALSGIFFDPKGNP